MGETRRVYQWAYSCGPARVYEFISLLLDVAGIVERLIAELGSEGV